MIRCITGKLQGMRKSVEWVVYSADKDETGKVKPERTIQSDNRIARINLETGKYTLSKHAPNNGFMHLSSMMGAKNFDNCPQEIIDQLKNLDADHGTQTGPVALTGVVMARN